MSLKPIAPTTKKKRAAHPAAMPVVIVQKKKSGSSGMLIMVIILAVLGGGYFLYSSQQQKNEEALAANQHQREQNARNKAENERLRSEHKKAKEEARKAHKATLLGTTEAPAATTTVRPSTSISSSSSPDVDDAAEEAPQPKATALGSTSAPTAGTGVFAVEDTSAPAYDLTATGNAAKKVIKKLDDAIEEASKGDTFHDLQADLKRSFQVAQPELFADASTLPPYPDKEERLLRLAQSICVCLNLASELAAEDKVPAEKHTKFVNWLMKDKAKAARTFTYGLEHYDLNDVETATSLLEKLRTTYLKDGSSSALESIPKLLKAAAK